MDTPALEREAAAVAATLPDGHPVAVIGGTSFWHPESSTICAILGGLLARIDKLLLLTGGVEGVGETVGRAFQAAAGGARVVHVLPRGFDRWDYGDTRFAGDNLNDRREILGRLAGVYVAIEGGPGTAHEASVALSRRATVIPIGRSGGHAGDLHPRLGRPPFASEATWRALADPRTTPEAAAAAAADIVASLLKR